jgi:AcrR family transcriptional regulator
MTTAGTDERRTDTRNQIRAVALELFAEQGYEKTSLREIAERLGVTKAAVYYHYRTKEEILSSLIEEHMAGMDAIAEWAEAQPPGRERRRATLERYSALLGSMAEGGPQLVRFMQENQTSIKELAVGARMRDRFERLAAILVEPDSSAADQLRSRLALAALHFGAFAHDRLPGDPQERRDAALEVALDLAAR